MRAQAGSLNSPAILQADATGQVSDGDASRNSMRAIILVTISLGSAATYSPPPPPAAPGTYMLYENHGTASNWDLVQTLDLGVTPGGVKRALVGVSPPPPRPPRRAHT